MYFANDQPIASDGSISQLVQAMAGLSGGSAADILNIVAISADILPQFIARDIAARVTGNCPNSPSPLLAARDALACAPSIPVNLVRATFQAPRALSPKAVVTLGGCKATSATTDVLARRLPPI
jgi:hypothetical protein